MLSATIPTRLNTNEPMKVPRAFCAVVSSISSFAARGVTLLVAALYAETMVVSEKVVTASMLVARIWRMSSIELDPIVSARPDGT